MKRQNTYDAFDQQNFNYECKKTKVGIQEEKSPTIVKAKSILSVEESSWNMISELQCEFLISRETSENICKLLDEGCSIPFIARYRREQTHDMPPDVLRRYKEAYEGYRAVKDKCRKLLTTIQKTGKLNDSMRRSLLNCRTFQELDLVYSPFKTGSKMGLAERARNAGLGPYAEDILFGDVGYLDFNRLQHPTIVGRSTIDEIEKGLKYIIGDILIHDKDFLKSMKEYQNRIPLSIDVKFKKPIKAETKTNGKTSKTKGSKEEDPRKFELYNNFVRPVQCLKSHQILAINRGESLKILTVKVIIPEYILKEIEEIVHQFFLYRGLQSKFRLDLVLDAIKDVYKRLLAPKITRTCRADLLKKAENESIETFAKNLKNLLLAAPLRGKSILGIDPGFSHGCKIAVISPFGDLLDTEFMYPRFNNCSADEVSIRKMRDLVYKYNVEILAIGNGTACRETEKLVNTAIQGGWFDGIQIQYTIVDERGASVYSCTDLAKQEFPKLHTNLISAVSLARRVQDPLSEYVKIEPRHLGCGMYQHDLTLTKLNSALEETVIECVSFVGVNINSCSEHLLERVAGLTKAKAKAIVEYRRENGNFRSRVELRKVKGIGVKVFEQCAGFIRILDDRTEPLDSTNIHPESYAGAKNLINLAQLDLAQLGSSSFRQSLHEFVMKVGIGELIRKLNIGNHTLNHIISSLVKGPGYDIREENNGPIFKTGITRLEDISAGAILSGRVTNVTAFGAFVDIGLGNDGLLHVSKMNNMSVELGDRIQVKLLNKDNNRMSLGLIEIF